MVPGPRCHIYSESWILRKNSRSNFLQISPTKMKFNRIKTPSFPSFNLPKTYLQPLLRNIGKWLLDRKTSHVKTLPNSLEENHSSIFGAPIQQAPGDARVNPRRAGPGVHPPTRRQPGTEASPHAAPCQEPCVWWAGALDPQHLRWMAGWLDNAKSCKIMRLHAPRICEREPNTFLVLTSFQEAPWKYGGFKTHHRYNQDVGMISSAKKYMKSYDITIQQ